MPVWNSAIGNLDWNACTGCIHSDPEQGGCDVPEDTLEASLELEYDTVFCGCYEERKDEE